MSYLRNTPSQHTVLTLAARKSFSLTLYLKDKSGSPLVLTDVAARWTISDPSAHEPSPQAVRISREPADVLPERGRLRFDLQAADLDLPSGEYPYEIVIESQGYSVIILSGVIDLQPSFDYDAVSSRYTDPIATGMQILQLGGSELTLISTELQAIGAPGAKGDKGDPGDPFVGLEMAYNPDGTIASVKQGDDVTFYTYNPDGTIASDERGDVERTYNYDNQGRLTAITMG